ncbi:hypothetical protein ILUMI_21242 [Ignelater luminosus]|uniref:DUF4371 domain-containing protein n=1 Tax=Ignelater luminosus TaxID=2038154 RepID=A0A8K0CJ72_IGNLU|nr:hypothetical protein ILUMI_21242 [Ignelater luminosus]
MSGRILRDPNSSVAWPAKRKRQRRKSDIIKKQKVAGEAHINHKGLHKPARATGLNCRGHSFLPNEQDFALIVKKKRIHSPEIPEEWDLLIREAREKPSQLNVVNMSQDMFFNIQKACSSYYLKSPRPSLSRRQARIIEIFADCTYVKVKPTYSGTWTKCAVRNKSTLENALDMETLYENPLPLSSDKLKNILALITVRASYLVAKTGKSHTVAENLILPAAMDMANRRYGGGIREQIVEKLKKSLHFALQFDESTNVTDCAQFVVFVRFEADESIIKDILFCKAFSANTTGQCMYDIFVFGVFLDNVNDEELDSNLFLWTKPGFILTGNQKPLYVQ